ncbi:MAG: hypothetical protein AB7G28_01530 [Pirellulales bacterium]
MLNTPTGRLIYSLLLTFAALDAAAHENAPPIPIGNSRELFLDDYLVDRLQNTTLELQQPREREIVITHGEPWEGCASTYHTVFRDGDLFRMYYRGAHHDEVHNKPTHEEVFCYAESRDGIHWTKPNLGLVEFQGSTANNIILKGSASHNLAPFIDENPNCRPAEKYKAVGGVKGGLVTFKSADAVHWECLSEKPVITKGYFDSLNTAFWDTRRGEYLEFHREYRDSIRDIMTCTSNNFLDWSEPEWLEYTDAPHQHLYTNAIIPYHRAPQILIGLPMRYVPGRNPERHSQDGVSDAGFMSSRDGKNFRRWNEAFVRPGLQADRWVNRNNLPARGIVETEPDVHGAPRELSFYATEGYYRGPATRLRRYTLRLDGFVSVSAPSDGGELITKPLVFAASGGSTKLWINFATSAVGWLKCELQDPSGRPIQGYSLDECDEIYGDSVDRTVTWSAGDNVSSLAGQPVRLRFVMQDADLYALEFRSTNAK